LETKAGDSSDLAYLSVVSDDCCARVQVSEVNGVEEYCFIAHTQLSGTKIIEKFDTAASRCMSGVPGRIAISKPDCGVQITGFNGSVSRSSAIGMNSDGKTEYFVESMPKDLVLLCGNAYASEGAAVLFKDSGVVLKLSEQQIHEFQSYIKQYPIIKELQVRNRTYEVKDSEIYQPEINPLSHPMGLLAKEQAFNAWLENALSTYASKFFNTKVKVTNGKVHVSNGTERILTLLLTGLSFSDWYHHVQNKSLDGIPPDVTTQMLNSFEHKYGRTPDIIRMALPVMQDNRTGLMTPPAPLTAPGQRVEVDKMEPDYNEESPEDGSRKVRKLPSHGQAIAASVSVDCYSLVVQGKLLTSTRNSMVVIEDILKFYHVHNIPIKLISADSGVISQGVFQVLKPEVEAFLHDRGIQTERAEPHNHSRGTSHVERAIRSIKDLIRIAVLYILRNPNFPVLGFSELDILKLWGELFHWAINIINLKVCPNAPTKSKLEVFTGVKPNMQNIRLLPIFSVVLAYRENIVSGSLSRTPHHDVGLYVGPSMRTPGAIRVAVMTNKGVSIVVTSRFRPGSDGGGLNVYPHVDRGLSRLLKDQEEQETKENEDNTASESSVPLSSPSPSSTVIKESLPNPPKVIDSSPAIPHNPYLYPRLSTQSPRRSDRIREILKSHVDQHNAYSAEIADVPKELIEAFMADWSTHNEHQMYFSFVQNEFVCVNSLHNATFDHTNVPPSEEGYRAVTENVPKTFSEALQHPLWGDAARTELNTLISTGAIVAVDAEVAKNAILKEGADLVILFPVYEQKMRDGEMVYKVRLVGDGRTHYNAGMTYSATPSREELLIILHLVAAFNWDYVHIDEKRAFLSAQYNGKETAYTKLRGKGTQFYQILGALYGLKTSPKDYQDKVADRFAKLGYKRLTMCSCIYTYTENEKMVLVYAFVDDFIFTGNDNALLVSKLEEFREIASTTEPLWNAPTLLGVELSRDKDRRIIKCKMEAKIEEVCAKFNATDSKRRLVPIPQSAFIIKDEDFEAMRPERSAFLTAKQRSDYLAVIGSLIWLSGVRLDILFAVLYLSWATKNPRQHHMHYAIHCLQYLYQSKTMPLVLGGSAELRLEVFSDASLGTAPKGRSTTGHLARLAEKSGGIFAKATATSTVMMSSFEAELDGASTAMKTISRIDNILTEIRQVLNSIPILHCDNLAMVEFLKGNGVAKSVRHMELRQWYVREKILKGDAQVLHHPGATLPADKLTKLADSSSHAVFVEDIMGHSLL